MFDFEKMEDSYTDVQMQEVGCMTVTVAVITAVVTSTVWALFLWGF